MLYGIGYDGRLYWMKHILYLSPVPDPGIILPGNPKYALWQKQWMGPVEIGSGMTGVTQIFSPGEGHIYYVRDDVLVWRQHTGWENGTNK